MEIALENVTKEYQPAGFVALKDITLNIAAGEWIFLVGASGMGKTTLLRLLSKEESPDRGRVLIGGQDVSLLSGSRLRRSMGIVFQSFRLLPRKTAYENIAYGAEVLGVPPSEVRRRTREILDLVGLQDKGLRLPSELSGGEQQRIAIGRALINRPSLIVADEPTGDLDPENSEMVLRTFENVNREKNTTILFATHAVELVNQLRKRVVRLEHGRVVRDAVGGYWGPEPQPS
jgi:cell division transport system ATP-binding protein